MNSSDKLLDPVGWGILQALQINARMSFTEIGRRVGLSDTAVADRVRRMEDAGIIRGYHAEVDYEMIGLPIMAYIHLNVQGSQRSTTAIEDLVRSFPQVLEYYSMAGADCYILKVVVRSVRQLDQLLGELRKQGNVLTNTSIILSPLMESHPITEEALADITGPNRNPPV